MGLENGNKSASSSRRGGISTRWYIAFGILLVLNLIVWFSGNRSLLFCSLFSILSLAILAAGKSVSRYQRLAYIVVIPGLLSAVLSGHLFYWAFSDGYGGLATQIFHSMLGETTGNVVLAVLLGLMVGILVPFSIVEIYVLMHEAAIVAFTGMDAKAARLALRTLVLNLNRIYFIVEGGKMVTSKPLGVFPKWGGPGLAIIQSGNAVVFQQGGKLSKVALSGTHPTEGFERVYKIINLTSRNNLSSPGPTPLPETANGTAPETAGKPSTGKNAKNVLTKDRIALDMDLKVSFQIKRKREQEQDPTLLAFSADRREKWPDAYLVDQNDVYKAATAVNDWEAAVGFVAEDILRDVIGQKTLDELFEAPEPGNPPEIRGKICKEIQIRLVKAVDAWGIAVNSVSIGEIDIPPEVRKQLEADWLAQKQNAMLISKSSAEAEAYNRIEDARIKVQTEMLRSIRRILEETGTEAQYSSRVLLTLRFIEALKEIASDPDAKALFPFGIPFQDMDRFKNQLLDE